MSVIDVGSDGIMALFKEKKQMFEAYHEATVSLKQSLEEEKTDHLPKWLDERDRIINRIERLNRAIAQCAKELNLFPDSILGKAEMVDGLEHINRLMHESAAIDKECIKLMTAEKDGVKREILKYRMNHLRITGYKNTCPGPARYIDTQVN